MEAAKRTINYLDGKELKTGSLTWNADVTDRGARAALRTVPNTR